MEENNKTEINDTENISVEITDKRREIDDLSDAELKELEKELEHIRANVRRYPDGWGEAHPLTGLMYCADCGGAI